MSRWHHYLDSCFFRSQCLCSYYLRQLSFICWFLFFSIRVYAAGDPLWWRLQRRLPCPIPSEDLKSNLGCLICCIPEHFSSHHFISFFLFSIACEYWFFEISSDAVMDFITIGSETSLSIFIISESFRFNFGHPRPCGKPLRWKSSLPYAYGKEDFKTVCGLICVII